MSRKALKFRTAKLGRPNRAIIKMAAGHNTRESIKDFSAYPNIDPGRSHLNKVLVGPHDVAGIAEAGNELMRAAGHDPDRYRVDGVRMLEVLCSLPASFPGDQDAYFRDCVSWAGERFGGHGNIVSAIVHHDEGAPHVHILLVPLKDGKMRGGKMADPRRQALIDDQSDFRARVAVPHGLCSSTRAMAEEERRALASKVVANMRRTADPAMKSRGWMWIRQLIEADPEAAAAHFGIGDTKSYDFDRAKTGEVISCGLCSPLTVFSAAPEDGPEGVAQHVCDEVAS